MRASSFRLLVASASAALVVALASPASAHVEADPQTVPAGESATIELVVGHGCDGLDTTGLQIQIPEGLDVEPEAPEGWSVTVEERVIAFEGGPLDDHDPLGFPLTFTAPDEAGTLSFPTVQLCGEESASWIGDADSDNPAPEVDITAAAGGSAASSSEPSDDGEDPAGATGATDTDDSAVDTTSEIESDTTAGSPAEDAAEPTEDDSGSSATPVVILAIVIIAAAIVGGLIYRGRGRGTGSTGGEDPEDATTD